MSDAVAGRYFNTVTNIWESALGFTGAPRAQLWAWQPSSLSLQPVTLDNTGSLVTSATLSGSAGNAAASLTGAGVPTSASYTGWNNAGTLVGASAALPLPVQIISGGGGGTQYADGVTQVTPTGTVALGKNPSNILHALGLDGSGNLLVSIPGSVAVTGAFWQATQPISAASLPLPAGAATAAKQPALGTSGVSSADVLSVQGIAGGTALPVSGTFFQATQPVSVATAVTVAQATAANLNATVVGVVAVSNLPATQPVSGTVTANQGGAPWAFKPDATIWTLTGTSANVNVTNTVPVTGTFWQATQPVSIAASVAVTGTFFQATQPVSIATMPTTPVTGVFFQATQPVSIAAMPTTPVTGTFFQAIQPISAADGAQISIGNTADAAWVSGSGSAISLLKKIASATVLTPATATIGAVATTVVTPIGMNDGNSTQAVSGRSNTGLFTSDQTAIELLSAVLVELRIMNLVLHSSLNSRDDLDVLRRDVSITPQLNS